jgi:glycosyltransferase involved in cell wall biosynthesis
VSRRVLLVAYYFPPLAGAGSLRALGFARHLPEFGWEPTVLAPGAGAYRRDPTIAFPADRVVRTASIELSRLGKRALRAGGSDTAPAAVGGWRARVRDVARSSLYFPDAQVGWAAPALLRGARLLREQRFDAVFSTSFPITAHVIGHRLSRFAGVPWIADFRDPWSEMLRFGGRPHARAVRLERRLARAASRVTMPSSAWAQSHGALWGRDVDVVLNGHTLDALPPAEVEESQLTYVGSFYPDTQDLQAIWHAMRRLPALRLRIVGEPHPAMLEQLTSHGLGERASWTGFVTADRVREELRSAGTLLLAGPNGAAPMLRGQIPAKVFEYLCTDRPVLCVGSENSDVAALLRSEPGCWVADVGDDVMVADALRESRGSRYPRDPVPLHRRARTQELAQLLDAV